MTQQLEANRLRTQTEALQNDRHESRVFVELRTDSAMRLVTGRPSGDGKAAIIGLLGFADRLRVIWDAAKRGDPYARWWLLKVEASTAKARNFVQAQRASVRKTLSVFKSLRIDLSRGAKPWRVELVFACPYAYHGAQLVRQVDALITELDTSVQIGARRKADTSKTQRNAERVLRRTFSSSQGYWDFGVTRELIQQRAPKAVDAEAKMGVIPDEVLNGNCWPRLLDRKDQSVTEGNTGE